MTEWIIDNVEPEHHQGIPYYNEGELRAEDRTIDSSVHTSKIYNLASGIFVGSVVSQCRWTLTSGGDVGSYNILQMYTAAGDVPSVHRAILGGPPRII